MSVFSRGTYATASVVAVLALAGCAVPDSGAARQSVASGGPYSCITASNFSKCRIDRDKTAFAPTRRPGVQ